MENRAQKPPKQSFEKTTQTKTKNNEKYRKQGSQRWTLGDPKVGQRIKVCLPFALPGGPGTQNASKTFPKGFQSHPKAPL